MTIIITTILLLSLILIACSPLTKVNKAAVAMFAAALGWMLYIAFGTDFVMKEHNTEFADFLSGATLNSDAVKEYIASNIFIKYVGKAAEIVLFLLATMTIVQLLNSNGCFDFLQKWLRTRHSRRLLWSMAGITLVVSANLDNVTTTTMMLVVMQQMIASRKHRAIFASVILLSANIGGAATVIGDTTGLYLWNSGAVTASHFFAWMLIPGLIAWGVPTFLISRKLPERIDLEPIRMPYRGDDTNLKAWQRIVMLFFAIGGLWFIPTFHNITKLSPFVGALCVLSLLWVVNEVFNRKLMGADQMEQQRIPRALQYSTVHLMLFVTGIMLMAGLMVETGASTWAGQFCQNTLGEAWTVCIAPLLAGATSLWLDSFATATSFFSMYSVSGTDVLTQNGEYWISIAYATAMGGTILAIGSMSGLAMLKMKYVTFGWYLRHFTPKVLIGALLGLAALIAEAYCF